MIYNYVSYTVPAHCHRYYRCIHNLTLIFYLLLDSADFDINPQTITFPREDDTLPVQVPLFDDIILEEKEAFIVALIVAGNVKEIVVGKQDSVMVTIEDNDGKYITICSVNMYVCMLARVCVSLHLYIVVFAVRSS